MAEQIIKLKVGDRVKVKRLSHGYLERKAVWKNPYTKEVILYDLLTEDQAKEKGLIPARQTILVQKPQAPVEATVIGFKKKCRRVEIETASGKEFIKPKYIISLILPEQEEFSDVKTV